MHNPLTWLAASAQSQLPRRWKPSVHGLISASLGVSNDDFAASDHRPCHHHSLAPDHTARSEGGGCAQRHEEWSRAVAESLVPMPSELGEGF
jgi:hypothetical protein